MKPFTIDTHFTHKKMFCLLCSSEQVLDQLKIVNFSRNGYHVSFDNNGDPVAFYELINWKRNENGGLEFVTVGHYDESLSPGQKFNIKSEISWADGGIQAGRTTHYLIPSTQLLPNCM